MKTQVSRAYIFVEVLLAIFMASILVAGLYPAFLKTSYRIHGLTQGQAVRQSIISLENIDNAPPDLHLTMQNKVFMWVKTYCSDFKIQKYSQDFLSFSYRVTCANPDGEHAWGIQ